MCRDFSNSSCTKLCGSVLNQKLCSFKLISTPSGTPNPNRIGRKNMEDIESGLVRWLRVTNLGDYRPQPKFHLLLTWAVSNHLQPTRWDLAPRARTGEVSPPI